MGRVLAPEVEALLVEIAGDPASNLLRVRRGEAAAELALGRGPLDSTSLLWTRSERTLLSAHRDEVATLLTRMAALAAMSSPALAGCLLVPEPPRADNLAETALRLLASGVRVFGEGEVEMALARAAKGLPANPEEPLALLAMALRLSEPKGARQWVPLALVAAGELDAARVEARALEQWAADGFGVSLAASNGGLAAWRLGDHRDAASWYRRAYLARPEESHYLLFHQINAYLAHVEGHAVELVQAPFPDSLEPMGFLRQSLAASPVPGWSARLVKARRTRGVPKSLRAAREVVYALA